MPTTTDHKACDLILFGTLGDLARRKLLPALYQLEKANLLAEETQLIGCARDPLNRDQYRQFLKTNLERFVTEPLDEAVLNRLQQRSIYVQMDLSQAADYRKLLDAASSKQRTPVSYLAVPPSLFGAISQGLASVGLAEGAARIVLEKPIGHNLASSIATNNQVADYFNENQIYRIDHYLGKETVLNLLVLRFANFIFSSNWDRTAIDHVQITVAEAVGVEGRWGYYDDAGQMRDMVQNHLLQILSLIAMEPPVSLDADSIRDEKLKVLKALRPIDSDNAIDNTVRGQYVGGHLGGTPVPGYLEEEGARAASTTETFVALKVAIDNWRWSGVPFYLRTGKRMAKKQSEVVIYFKSQPHNIFAATCPQLNANKLIIRLQPDEGVEIQIMNKIPGLGETMQLKESQLDLSFNKTFETLRIADAYERLLLEAMLGHQYLFVRRDEVEQAWQWVDGILKAWEDVDVPLHSYPAGSFGPDAAETLLARHHHQWD